MHPGTDFSKFLVVFWKRLGPPLGTQIGARYKKKFGMESEIRPNLGIDIHRFGVLLPCPLYFLYDLRLFLFIVDVIGFLPCDVPLIVGSCTALLNIFAIIRELPV